MVMPKVSVIIPIYKAEETLLRCLDSLKAQTFADFEVLMVDDGSPDLCGQMIDDYAQKDSRFKAFHKGNGGVSSARQFGIDHAIGEYTIHADPDDWVEPTMLEDLYRKAKEEDADMVMCDIFRNDGSLQLYGSQRPTALDHNSVLRDVIKGRIYGYCVNKLVRLDVYKKHKVIFPVEFNVSEDQYVICQILKIDIKISYLPKAYYHYVTYPESLSRRYDNHSYQNDLIMRDMFVALMSDTDLKDYTYTKKTSYLFGRAFMYGKEFFSSKEFKKHFSEYEHTVFEIPRSKTYNFLYWLSFRGFYQVAIRLYSWLFSMKQITKR